MIRVLQVVNKMGYGGIETFLMNIYRNIDRNKIQFDFAVHTKEKGEYDEEIKRLGGNIYYFNSRRNGINKYYRDWNKFLKENAERYNAIHMHVSSLTTVLPIKLAKKYKIKNIIVHSHSTSQYGKIHNILNLINQKRINQFATKLLACSTDAGKYTFGKNKFSLCFNGIDVDKYTFDKKKREKIRELLKIQDDELALVHVGRFVTEKNHKFLVQIFEEISKLNPKAKMFLIGKGPLKDEIEKIVNSKKLIEKIEFLGIRNDVYDILQGMDAFVFPSIFEGLPVAMIEAQASGLPIFASENIPSETKISNLVNFLSLEEKPHYWAKTIFNEINIERNDMKEAVQDAGYNIKNTVDIVSKIYIN